MGIPPGIHQETGWGSTDRLRQTLSRETTRLEALLDLCAVPLANLSYLLLNPLCILHHYTQILCRQRRILVLGPPCTGKTHLVEALGHYVSLISAPSRSFHLQSVPSRADIIPQHHVVPQSDSDAEGCTGTFKLILNGA